MHNFKKNFGQNFLRNSKFAKLLVKSLDLKEGDTVIEIGPGEGSVTKQLLDKKCKVICIEIDYDLLAPLIKRFNEDENFQIVNQDILKVDLNTLVEKFSIKGEIKVIGSLPFNISKKIINKFIQFNLFLNIQDKDLNKIALNIVAMSFIVQEEVAKEYIALAPKSSFLSNYIKIFANVRKLESIPNHQFYPIPKVNGAILNINLHSPITQDYNDFIKLIRIGFLTPRKTLLRNLINSNKYNKDLMTKLFIEQGLDLLIRSAELTQENWLNLFKQLSVN